MRAIKFKAIDLKTKEWRFGNYIFTEQCTASILDTSFGARKEYPVICNTVCQFTGITDKNGKEVYEGDILYSKYNDVNEELGYYEVENEVAFQFGSYGFIGEITGEFLPFSIYPITTEIVIGNIHDK